MRVRISLIAWQTTDSQIIKKNSHLPKFLPEFVSLFLIYTYITLYVKNTSNSYIYKTKIVNFENLIYYFLDNIITFWIFLIFLIFKGKIPQLCLLSVEIPKLKIYR